MVWNETTNWAQFSTSNRPYFNFNNDPTRYTSNQATVTNFTWANTVEVRPRADACACQRACHCAQYLCLPTRFPLTRVPCGPFQYCPAILHLHLAEASPLSY